jgi:hypothetical protein
MIEFEDQLRSALGRRQAPPDFARHVLARAARLERQRVLPWHSWAAGCLAASLLVGCLGFANYEQRRELEQARDARGKVLQALAITSGKLRRIEKRVEGISQ